MKIMPGWHWRVHRISTATRICTTTAATYVLGAMQEVSLKLHAVKTSLRSLPSCSRPAQAAVRPRPAPPSSAPGMKLSSRSRGHGAGVQRQDQPEWGLLRCKLQRLVAANHPDRFHSLIPTAAVGFGSAVVPHLLCWQPQAGRCCIQDTLVCLMHH